MLLRAIQDNLAALYETPIEHCVMDFLITDAGVADALEPNHAQRTNSERILLRESAGDLDISVYIDKRVLEALVTCDPYEDLNAGNINDFLIALEGVSHFNYIIWNAVHARQITRFELELQAEVDKFVSALMLFDQQGSDTRPDRFHDTLFEDVMFDESLDVASGQRYVDANHYAAKYCRRLTRQYPGQHRETSFINELRRFYRLPQNQKVRRIEHH